MIKEVGVEVYFEVWGYVLLFYRMKEGWVNKILVT